MISTSKTREQTHSSLTSNKSGTQACYLLDCLTISVDSANGSRQAFMCRSHGSFDLESQQTLVNRGVELTVHGGLACSSLNDRGMETKVDCVNNQSIKVNGQLLNTRFVVDERCTP